MRFISSSILGLAICGVFAFGCSSSSDTGGGGDTGTQVVDTGSGGTDTGSSQDTGGGSDSTADTSEGGSGFALKIEDYLNWCNVSVNGGAVSTADPQNFGPFPSGTKVNLVGDTASSAAFVWGYWRGTDGDTGATHDTNKTTTVTITKDTVVQACCPLVSAPTTPCPDPT